MADDQIVMYVIVRSSLGMSSGKICAQMGHLSWHMAMEYAKLLAISSIKRADMIPNNGKDHIKMTTDWMHNSSAKIVKKATDEEWNSVKEMFRNEHFIVRDSGKNQVPSGSETILGVWPMYKSQTPELIRKLPLL